MTGTPPLGIALIGTEFMGHVHSHAWRNASAIWNRAPVEMRVLAGTNPEKTRVRAASLGWQEASTDWRSVVERDDVQIVDICSPGHLHAEIAIAALDAGKHVLVEKPLASTLQDSERMVAAAQDARARGVRSMVGFNYRRLPALAHARDIIQSSRIGTVRQLRLSFLQDWLADETAPMSWRLRKETAGSGVLGDLGSHLVDQAQFLLAQPITSVSAHCRTFVTERPGPHHVEKVTVDDAFWATAFTDSGVALSLEASRVATGQKSSFQVEVYGSAGAIRFDLQRLNELWLLENEGPEMDRGFRQVLMTEPTHPYLEAWWPPGHVLGWEHTFTNQVADLLRNIERGENPTPSFEDGFQVETVLAAIERSAMNDGILTPISTIQARPKES